MCEEFKKEIQRLRQQLQEIKSGKSTTIEKLQRKLGYFVLNMFIFISQNGYKFLLIMIIHNNVLFINTAPREAKNHYVLEYFLEYLFLIYTYMCVCNIYILNIIFVNWNRL